MSRDRYFELYKKFVNHTISKREYEELMEWVADDRNDKLLRNYMEKIWDENEVAGETRSLNALKNQLESRSGREATLIRKKRILRIGYAAAAVLVLVVMSYVGYRYFRNDLEIYQTAYGETLELELEDGSQVTLNANTTLTWNRRWKKEKERRIYLEGEAFFDVLHTEDDLPFVVFTNDLTVNVLGTTFSVRSRENKTDVVLESGKVKLDLNRPRDRILEMIPGDRIHYSAAVDHLEKDKVEEVDTGLDWMEGVLRFEDVSVAEMFSKIEELYGKKLVTEDEELLARRLFTGIPFEDWEVARQAIELALGVETEEENGKIRIK